MFPSRLKRRTHPNPKIPDLSGHLATIMDPAGTASEAYRLLRTNLLYSHIDVPPTVIVVASPGSREGKSITCANLGVVLAQADKNPLILDCDFRKPTIHKIFGLRNTFGLVNILVGERMLEDVCNEPLPGLKVLPVGPIPPNPTELLSSKRFGELLEQVRRGFDYVLVDVPPLHSFSDATIVATQCDGVLLVLDAQNTRKESVRRSVRNLEAVGADFLGTVMNKVKGPVGNDYPYNGYADKY
jgi:capsular exopolysaccharide synthesis family protein